MQIGNPVTDLLAIFVSSWMREQEVLTVFGIVIKQTIIQTTTLFTNVMRLSNSIKTNNTFAHM